MCLLPVRLGLWGGAWAIAGAATAPILPLVSGSSRRNPEAPRGRRLASCSPAAPPAPGPDRAASIACCCSPGARATPHRDLRASLHAQAAFAWQGLRFLGLRGARTAGCALPGSGTRASASDKSARDRGCGLRSGPSPPGLATLRCPADEGCSVQLLRGVLDSRPARTRFGQRAQAGHAGADGELGRALSCGDAGALAQGPVIATAAPAAAADASG